MKKILLLFAAIALFSYDGKSQSTNNQKETITPITYTDVKDKSFDELYKAIPATEITDNVFKLIGQDFSVITAGTDSLYNSMTASYGGWGQLFEAPVAWCFLNASRYTLEFIKQEKTYTMSYFPDQFKKEVLFFGSKSGRESDKMKNNKLTFVKTPSGNITYKEAKMVVECKLIEITTTNPNDFYTEESRAFVEKGIKDGNGKEYHKLVFGQITNVWVRK